MNIWGALNNFLSKNSAHIAEPWLLEGFIEPEIFKNQIFESLHANLKLVNGPSLALYYDATPITLPELSPRNNTRRFPYYLQQLLQFDGVAAISQSSKAELESYWGLAGSKKTAGATSNTLGVNLAHTRYPPPLTQDQELKNPMLDLLKDERTNCPYSKQQMHFGNRDTNLNLFYWV